MTCVDVVSRQSPIRVLSPLNDDWRPRRKGHECIFGTARTIDTEGGRASSQRLCRHIESRESERSTSSDTNSQPRIHLYRAARRLRAVLRRVCATVRAETTSTPSRSIDVEHAICASSSARRHSVESEARLLSVRDTADRLGISLSTLDRIRRSGEIGCTRIGRRVLFSPNQIDIYVKQQSEKACPIQHDSLNTTNIGWSDAATLPISISTGAHREVVASAERARTQRILTKQSGDWLSSRMCDKHAPPNNRSKKCRSSSS